jgi:dTDP-4-amino-4,6-dideoxygalactose transaminase
VVQSNLRDVLTSGARTHLKFGPLCEERLQRDFSTRKAMLVGSATAALEICAICVGAQAGVEVIVPSFTFVSTANAFVTHGATPVFVDIRADTQNIDESKIEAAITPRTRAIVCVHYSGVACEMDEIMAIARRHRLLVVEDNAHGPYASYKGRMLGTIGDMGAISFHYTKNIVCGEGGALLVNNPALVRAAALALEKGTNRMDFLAGRVDRCEWNPARTEAQHLPRLLSARRD